MEQPYTTQISNPSPSPAQEPWPYNMLRHRLFWVALFFWLQLVGSLIYTLFWRQKWSESNELMSYAYYVMIVVLAVISMRFLFWQKLGWTKRYLLSIGVSIGAMVMSSFLLALLFGTLYMGISFGELALQLITSIWTVKDPDNNLIIATLYYIAASLPFIAFLIVLIKAPRLSRRQLLYFFIIAITIAALTLNSCTKLEPPGSGW